MSGWQPEQRARRAAPQPAAGPSLVVPLGQGEALQRLLRQARTLLMPHGVLIAGARGSGKTTVARWLAAALLCPSELDRDGPCGACSSCRRVASGAHADLHQLERAHDEREAKADGTSVHVITIDQVRQVLEALAHHAVAGGARVLLIEEAERLHGNAQQALLKTLEEPGAATFLLLQSSAPEALLPTMLSRVQRLPLRPLDDETLAGELSRRLPQRADAHARAMRLARGSLGLSLQLCTEQAVQLHDLVLALLGDIQQLRPVATARAVLDGQRNRREAGESAALFLRLLRAELGARLQALEGEADAAYAAAQSESWCRCIELALAAEQDVLLHIPAEQALTACLLQMQDA